MLGCRECCFAISVTKIEEMHLDDYILIIEGLCSGCIRIYDILEAMEW